MLLPAKRATRGMVGFCLASVTGGALRRLGAKQATKEVASPVLIEQ